ncbi:MAG: sensor histidine kinase [Bacteroidia bacterium]
MPTHTTPLALSKGLLMLLLCISTSSYGQLPDLSSLSIDSALVILDERLSIDSTKMETLEYGYELLGKAKQSGNQLEIAKTYSFLAGWHDYYNIYEPDSIKYHHEQALALYEALDMPIEVADTKLYLSKYYLNNTYYDEAKEVIFEALEITEALGDSAAVGRVYKFIATLFNVLEDNEQAIKYGHLSLQMLKNSDDHYTRAIMMMNLAPMYIAQKEYQAAIETSNDALKLYHEQDMYEIGILLRAQYFRGDAYRAMGEYAKAEVDYLNAFEIVLKEVGPKRAQSWEMDIGVIKLLQNKAEEALPYLLHSVEFYDENSMPQPWEPYGYLADCYKQLGNYEQALLYTEKARDTRDTMFTSRIAQLESESLIKYETDKKDEAIVQKNQLIEEQRTNQILGFSLAGVFALLVLALSYLFVRNRSVNRQLGNLNASLQQSNLDKEVLLKEIHHRVKNNLQTISSLLYLQSAHIKDKSVKAAVAAGQHRVQSMALIHQKLYQRDNLAAIEMKDYLSNLGQSLISTFAAEPGNIDFQVDMQSLELDVDTAVPIGLIVNELLTNSLKYAFREGEKGIMGISLQKSGPKLHLSVWDNGQGAKAGEEAKGTAFGSQLVQMLCTQLHGSMEIKSDNGYKVELILEPQTEIQH